MERRLLIICVFLQGLLAVSCLRDVEIDLDPVPDRIVLNASVCSDREIRAHLSKTWFIMDSVPDFELPEAEVRVYINDQFRGVMRKDDAPDDSTTLRGQYLLPGCYARPGDRVRIEAGTDGFEPVAGETSIPRKTEIAGVDTVFYKSSLYMGDNMRLYVRAKERYTGYFRLIVEHVVDYRKGDSVRTISSNSALDTYDWFRASLSLNYEDPVFQSFGGSPIVSQMDGRFCMGVFSGNDASPANTVQVSFWPVEYSYEDDTLSVEARYDVRLLSISEEYYRYMKVMRGFSITIGDANFGALIEPADTYSNVEHGFGIVAGYQESVYRITMPKDTVPPYWNPWDGYRPF